MAAAAADAVVLSVLGKVTGLAAISGGRWLAVGLGIPVTAAAGLVVFRVSGPRFPRQTPLKRGAARSDEEAASR